ncbi:MAG: hypothetical protein ACFE91_16540 [Promethearchaeota archaeon]
MPYIVATMWYPSHKQSDVIKQYLKIVKKYPADETLFKQLCAPVTTTKKGIKILSIWEVKEGKLEAALGRTARFYYEFINVEGCEYKIKVWYTFDEASGISGLEIPD